MLSIDLTDVGGQRLPNGWVGDHSIDGKYFTYMLFDKKTNELLKVGKSLNFRMRVNSEYLGRALDEGRQIEAVLFEMVSNGAIKTFEKSLRKSISQGIAYRMPWDIGRDRMKLKRELLEHIGKLSNNLSS